MGLQQVLTILPIAALVIAVLSLVLSYRKAYGDNQRALRQRLRDVLRTVEATHADYDSSDNFEHAGFYEAPDKFVASAKDLEKIRQDGLRSPNQSHIGQFDRLLREFAKLHNQSDSLPQAGNSPDMNRNLIEAHGDKVRAVLSQIESRVAMYLPALARMDNAGLLGYWTYLRYRVIPASR